MVALLFDRNQVCSQQNENAIAVVIVSFLNGEEVVIPGDDLNLGRHPSCMKLRHHNMINAFGSFFTAFTSKIGGFKFSSDFGGEIQLNCF